MQPDLELKFAEQSINDQNLWFLDLGTEISSERTRASQSNWTTQEPNGTWTPSQYIKYPSPVISRLNSGIFSKFHMDGSFQKLIDWNCRQLKMMKNDTNMTYKL